MSAFWNSRPLASLVAALDGAGPARLFWHVTLPQMSPIILFNALTGIIGALQIFTQAYIITDGGPLVFDVNPLGALVIRQLRLRSNGRERRSITRMSLRSGE